MFISITSFVYKKNNTLLDIRYENVMLNNTHNHIIIMYLFLLLGLVFRDINLSIYLNVIVND